MYLSIKWFFPRCQCKPGFEGEFCQNSGGTQSEFLPPRHKKEPKPEKTSMLPESEKSENVVRPVEGEERHPAFPEKLGNPLEKLN